MNSGISAQDFKDSSWRRPGFLHWFYNEGIHGLLEIWKNFLFFCWRYFSIGELFSTLISPWHRDVEIRNWRGWNPKRALEMLLENLLSRMIGMVVRIFVIAFGLVSFLLFFATGIISILVWICSPLLLIGLAVYSLLGFVNPFFYLGAIIWICLVLIFYFSDTEAPILTLEGKALLDHAVFERICARLGIVRKKFPDEILENEELLADFLKIRSLEKKEYQRIVKWELERFQQKKDSTKFWQWQNLKKIIPIGMQWRYGFTVHLDRYCIDLSEGDNSEYSKTTLIGRKNEQEILKLILTRPDQNCALVVGNAGIGRKTLIHSMAVQIRKSEVEKSFQNMRIMLLDLGSVISDAINREEDVENRIRTIFYEAAMAGNVILVIEHIEHYLGGEGNMLHPDISAILVEFLALPAFRLIATSSPSEYHQLIEKKQQVIKYFETIEMSEPSEVQTIKIMMEQLEKYEYGRVLFTYCALREIVASSSRHNWNSPLPERALDMMMDVLMFWDKKSGDQFVTEKTVDEYLSLKTGVKQGEVEYDERKKLLNLENTLHRQVIGQDDAVNQVAEALRRARSGIGDSQKPIGSFLFLGPTGVGKTETAKALSKVYFGDEKHVIRLDMSEFQNPNSIDRLLGSSHLKQPGRLVTQIKDNPYSLLLLDEIEKAYPDILDIFLQILDEGFVTDAFGEKINFRNCLIIATSNAGATIIKKMVENQAQADEIKQAVIDHAVENSIFKVEFLNRFDGVIFFRPLKQKELADVVRLKLKNFAKRLDKEKNIQIDFAEDLVENIIEKGYDPIFGARSLNRYIEDTVENLVAKKIISGELNKGGKMTISL